MRIERVSYTEGWLIFYDDSDVSLKCYFFANLNMPLVVAP
jgi:hypothetical protein